MGALLYLVDAETNRNVAAISSVSGGSITNGVIAHETDFAHVGAATFEARMAPLVRHVASTGLFFWGRGTNAYVLSVFAGALAGLGGIVTAVVFLCLEGLSWRAGATVAGAALVLAVTAWWFERRSNVVEGALARAHFHRDGRPTLLRDLDSSVDHVFCTTELQSGQHLYIAPRFMYSYRLGVGTPAQLRLSTAVQASACLPGAFSPRRLPTRPHAFSEGVGAGAKATDMLLTDGGVYDNMADQWLDGLQDRLRRLPQLPVTARTLDEVIVVNSSSPPGWTPLRRARLLLAGELATLKRVNSVMYQVTTQRRRQASVRAWDAAARGGEGQRGALIHIAQSPFTVADAYRSSTAWPERATRAQDVLTLLEDGPEGRAAWQRRAEDSRAVPTVLRALGREVTVDLLEHSYIQAMCNLHVLLDYKLLSLPDRARFARLLDGPP
ncbi:hypothetical protein PH190_14820 [Actinomycetospora straminea]|nr:patatin-like phospholipase family protein [Actinomycetospora straminea]MDD7933725.1 hypothetical protein [Actinomycetospora straminea]